MKCWHCDSDAKAICVFCGRALCAAHRVGRDYFVGYGAKQKVNFFQSCTITAATVKDASWCGVCKVSEESTF